MKTLLTTILFLLALTGCKIDLTIIGLGAVKTDSGSIDCAAGTTGDCHQEYVTNANDCTVAGNCTVVGANGTTETFNALPSDDSSFGGWGDICFGAANLQCTHTITPDYAADPDAQLNVTATFDPDPTPQNATYLYNAQGQRSSKTVNGVTTHFVYSDVDGQLLGEYNATGSPIREYIYLEGERVAMYDYTTVEPKDSTNQKAIVYLHNNQVGQVQYAFNSDGQMIYERVQTPFGETMGEMSAAGLQLPVRFPGQYYDSESGFNENWNRSYDPGIGRYVQSDPIGLGGGINTYLYVNASPVMYTDRLGLDIDGGSSWGWSPPFYYPPGFPTPPEHKDRNRNNSCPQKEPEDGCDGWSKDPDWYGGGRKYRNEDGSECAYDDNGDPLPDDGDNYTYNYAQSPTFKDSVKDGDHWKKDVVPNIFYGYPNGGQTPPAYNP